MLITVKLLSDQYLNRSITHAPTAQAVEAGGAAVMALGDAGIHGRVRIRTVSLLIATAGRLAYRVAEFGM
jgi:hypothetical protein